MMNTLVGKRERERTGDGERERAREREEGCQRWVTADRVIFCTMRTPHRTVEKRWWELVAKAPFLIIAALCFTNPIPPRVDSGT